MSTHKVDAEIIVTFQGVHSDRVGILIKVRTGEGEEWGYIGYTGVRRPKGMVEILTIMVFKSDVVFKGTRQLTLTKNL